MVDPKSLRKEDANLLQATRHPAVSASSKPWLIAMLVVLPQNEMRIWSRVNHPNCVRLLAVCLECVLAVRHTCRVLWWTCLGCPSCHRATEYCMISELCEGGALSTRCARAALRRCSLPNAPPCSKTSGSNRPGSLRSRYWYCFLGGPTRHERLYKERHPPLPPAMIGLQMLQVQGPPPLVATYLAGFSRA